MNYAIHKIMMSRLGAAKRWFCLVIILSFILILLLTNTFDYFTEFHPLGRPRLNEPMTCKIPYFPINDSEVMKLLAKKDRITCNGSQADWVHNNGTHVYVAEAAKIKFGSITCKFSEIERDGDFASNLNPKQTDFQVFKFETSDFVKVDCEAKKGKARWSSFFASPRPVKLPKPQIRETKLSHPKLNVLIWGHDSLSRNMFMRKLKSTYNYLKNELNGHVLEVYNIVGDGTPAALIPILTGSTEEELPETRRSMKEKAKPVDLVYPFIWKGFRDHGYLTGYMEDSPDIGTFQYRLKGFQDQPTDFYMRTFFLAAASHYRKFQNYCLGSIPRHKVVMNYVMNIMNMNREVPKFVFSFHSELSHGDVNLIEGADSDLTEFLQQLNTSGSLNETILIIMSDHGSRFSNMRETQLGKLEERLPMFMFVFPPWFKHVYPTAYRNFIVNTKILSTPFDIHETLQDVFHFTDASSDEYFNTEQSSESRGLSLFREIPATRTCSQAAIGLHWCTCLQWDLVPINSTNVQRAAMEFVKFINGLTDANRRICSMLELSRVLWSATLSPTEELMKFKGSSDRDGRVADLTGATDITKYVYQLKIETKPGLAHFETSINYDIRSETFEIQESEISRINKYGVQAKCVEAVEQLKSLRKYCYCMESFSE